MKIAEFLRQLRASDCFLANVKRLPSFPTIEQQFDKLMIFLEAAKFNEEQCTKAAEQVQKLSMFSSQNVERLLQKVAEACANRRHGGNGGPSTEAQDYSTIFRFVPDSVWQRLNGHGPTRLHELCGFAAKLGLICPTEKTVGVLTVILFWKEWQHQKISATERYKILQGCRAQIRGLLEEYGSVAKNVEMRLPQLPPVFSELPPSHKRVLEDESIGSPRQVTPELEDAVRSFKVRSSASDINPQSCKNVFMKWLGQIDGPHTSESSFQNQPEILPIEDGRVDSQEQAMSIVSGESASKKSVSLAKPELFSSLKTELTEVKGHLQKKKSVAETLLDLKSAYHGVKDSHKLGEDSNGTTAKKRPVPAAEAHTEKNETSPPKGNENKSKKQKEPKSILKGKDSKAKKTQTKEPVSAPKGKADKAHKQKLSAVGKMEKKEKPALKMDKKNVASRAYHQMLNLKIQEGLCKEQAKCFARSAHMEAADRWDFEHRSSLT